MNKKTAKMSVMTHRQRILAAKHGTPAEFAAAAYKSVPEFCSMDEARVAIAKYNNEWNDASNCSFMTEKTRIAQRPDSKCKGTGTIVQQIPRDELTVGKWYMGRGAYSNIGLWIKEGRQFYFLTVDTTLAGTAKVPLINKEGYYTKRLGPGFGTFQPFVEIGEGEVHEPLRTGSYYAKTLEV